MSARIAIDGRPAWWYRGTGIGNYTRQLIQWLVALTAVPGCRADEEYLVLWPPQAPPPPVGPGWRVHRVPRDRDTEAVAINKLLRRERPDVYHVPQNGMRVPANLWGSRLVLTLHDLIPIVMPEAVRHSYCRRFLHEVPAAADRASMVIVVSEHTARDVGRILGVEQGRTRVVYPAAEAKYRRVRRSRARAATLAGYGVAGEYLLYVGGLNPRKNVMDLVYAFSKVCRDLWPQLSLVITGSSAHHQPPLRGLVEALRVQDYVHFAGHVADRDLPALYSGAQFTVYPSLYEGFGLPPLEAMACGTPVICSDAASLPEVVGDAAEVVAAGDVTGLAGAITRLAREPAARRRLVERGRRRAAVFSWERAAAQIRAVYLEVAAQEERSAG